MSITAPKYLQTSAKRLAALVKINSTPTICVTTSHTSNASGSAVPTGCKVVDQSPLTAVKGYMLLVVYCNPVACDAPGMCTPRSSVEHGEAYCGARAELPVWKTLHQNPYPLRE